MDEEMGDAIEFTFTAVEIDLDYEFDAARFFDFSREESVAEACEAELWFESATSYPPSPFVMKFLMRKDLLLVNVNTSPKSKDAGSMILLHNDSEVELGEDCSIVDVNKGGLTFHIHLTNGNSKAKTKSSMKQCFPRSSTLMKPTVSQLAKQNKLYQGGDSRFLKNLFGNNEGTSENPCGIESQAAKRQKLEKGHLRKVADSKQQPTFVHKVPKKDGTTDGNSVHSKLKITIPREPELETAHRAQRMRPRNGMEFEQATSTARRFKALPLNRKILEAPSLLLPKRSIPRMPEFQEFHLKTSERAMQHTSANLSSSAYCSNSDKVLHKPSTNSIGESGNDARRSNAGDAPEQEKCEIHIFKACPLSKKIFSSKGDIGVFLNDKREITRSMEFNFHTEQRVQQNPPTELFNKLSLTEQKLDAGSQLKLHQPVFMPKKGSKENRLGSFRQECEIHSADKSFGERKTTLPEGW